MTAATEEALAATRAAAPRWPMRINVGRIATHLALLFFVVLWTFPTAGLLISSLRDPDQLRVSGWWTALAPVEASGSSRLGRGDAASEEGGRFVIRGTLLGDETNKTILSYGATNSTAAAVPVGQPLAMTQGGEVVIESDGDFIWSSPTAFTHTNRPPIYYVAGVAPRFTLENYQRILTSSGLGQSFVNSFTVAIPATLIPILVAAFAAYALAWMRFPGRTLLVAVIVGLLVVPLQMSLVPVLRFYNTIAAIEFSNTWIGQGLAWLPWGNLLVRGIEQTAGWIGMVIGQNGAKGYLSVWLAHTAFGLPLAVYLLRNYMATLPREIMESARIDGASHFQIFTTMVLPLSFPALASFAIFQFLWIWNDLLVALIFLGNQPGEKVLTASLVDLLGTQGSNWELLTAGAFITIIVPLTVFLSLQRYFVRGLLAGSVK